MTKAASPPILKATPLTPASQSSAPSQSLSTPTSKSISAKSVTSQRRSPEIFFTVVLASATFGVTAWFAQATFTNQTSSRTRDVFKNAFGVDLGDTLTVLAVLSGVLSLLMRMLLENMLESIQWALTGRDSGVALTTILGLSPTTGAMGTIGILLCKHSDVRDRLFSAFK